MLVRLQKKLDHLYIADGNVWYSCFGKSMTVSYKTKHCAYRTTHQFHFCVFITDK